MNGWILSVILIILLSTEIVLFSVSQKGSLFELHFDNQNVSKYTHELTLLSKSNVSKASIDVSQSGDLICLPSKDTAVISSKDTFVIPYPYLESGISVEVYSSLNSDQYIPNNHALLTQMIGNCIVNIQPNSSIFTHFTYHDPIFFKHDLNSHHNDMNINAHGKYNGQSSHDHDSKLHLIFNYRINKNSTVYTLQKTVYKKGLLMDQTEILLDNKKNTDYIILLCPFCDHDKLFYNMDNNKQFKMDEKKFVSTISKVVVYNFTMNDEETKYLYNKWQNRYNLSPNNFQHRQRRLGRRRHGGTFTGFCSKIKI